MSTPVSSPTSSSQEYELDDLNTQTQTQGRLNSSPLKHAGTLDNIPQPKFALKRDVHNYGVFDTSTVNSVDSLRPFAAQQSKLPMAPERQGIIDAVAKAFGLSKVADVIASVASGTVTSLIAKPAAMDKSLSKMQERVVSAGGSGCHPDVQPTALFAQMEEQVRGVSSTFWDHAPRNTQSLRPAKQLTDALDALVTEDTQLIGLTLSFAFQRAIGPQHDEAVQQGALNLLRPESQSIVGMASGGISRLDQNAMSLEERLALDVLGHVANNNQFREMLALLGHHNLSEDQMDGLQAMMQAYHVTRQPAATNGGEAGEEPGGPIEFARKAMQANCQRLQAGEGSLSGAQKACAFAWQNGFRDEKEGGDLANAKMWLETIAKVYGHEDGSVVSPLNAMKLGLGGAEQRTLAEEAAKVYSDVNSTVMHSLVQALRDETSRRIGAATNADEKAKLIARLVALDVWSQGQRESRGFELNDVVNGRSFKLGTTKTIESRDIERYCSAAVENRPIPTDGGELLDPSGATSNEYRSLVTNTRKALGETSINLATLQGLALEYGIDEALLAHGADDSSLDKIFEYAQHVINGDTVRTESGKIDEAVKLIRDFYLEAQFGNNFRFSSTTQYGLNSRGTSVNIASYVESSEDAKHKPIVPRINIGGESGVSYVMRNGAATHGTEWIVGEESSTAYTGGGGAVGGITGGPENQTGLGRFAGGGDIGVTRNEVNFKGLAIRVYRNVKEDGIALDETPPRYQHDDDRILKLSSDLHTEMRDRALGLRRAREADPNSDIDVGQAMLELLASKGLNSGISMGLTEQTSKTWRVEAGGSASGSVTTPGSAGLRFSAGGGLTAEMAHTEFEQNETTGTLRVVARRDGAYLRGRTNASLNTNVFIGTVGLPSADLLSGTLHLGEAGGNAKVRHIYHKDKTVPRFSFADAEFPDLHSYASYLEKHRDELAQLFSYRHGGDMAVGHAEVQKHLDMLAAVEQDNHIYYARQRLRVPYATQLDQIRGLIQLLPEGMTGFGAELDGLLKETAGDPLSTLMVSGIVYSPQSENKSLGVNTGIRAQKSTEQMQAEREIVFRSEGWAATQNFENETNRALGL